MIRAAVYERTLLRAGEMGERLRQAATAEQLPLSDVHCTARYRCEKCSENLCVIGATGEKARPEAALARRIRELREEAHLVFLIDGIADVRELVNPAIRPSAMLMRPPGSDELAGLLREVYEDVRRRDSAEASELFTFKAGGSQYRVATHNISFFEARGKKIAMKTNTQEVEFYASFAAILEMLPDWFIRCHKGYLVNTRRITAVRASSMRIELDDGCVIPFSRSYREDVRAALRGEPTDG